MKITNLHTENTMYLPKIHKNLKTYTNQSGCLWEEAK